MVSDREPSTGIPPSEQLSVTLTFKPTTFKMSNEIVIGFTKTCPYILEIGEKMHYIMHSKVLI